MLLYLFFGNTDPILLYESLVMVLTPWFCLGGALLADRVLRGEFDARQSYLITTVLVTFLFLAIPFHCGCMGEDIILETAFKFSALVSLFFLGLTYGLERLRDKMS